ncbi:MAG: hypothetical protein DRI23_06645 [Candidatus Cloacimonadota bacterium]|nr:MAG: hypothetical protein DRI23_06645 [Candidatus Cloacimonadota bacterium]
MSNNMENQRTVFKYNMSFYYKSTIIYFIVLVLYLVIRGEFVEDSFKLITKDPLLYFLAIIVISSVLSLLYNLFRNKHININDDGISFIDRFKTRSFKIDQIKQIKFTRQRRTVNTKEFRNVRIKINSRIRPILIRLSDYENQAELLKRFEELKSLTENNIV